jgi:subtilisin family serine protease
VSSSHAQAILSDRLKNELDRAAAINEPVQALVVLSDQVDIQTMDRELYAQKASMNYRAYAVITQLQEKAESTQGDLLAYLNAQPTTAVLSFKSFWVINMVVVKATPSALLELSRRVDVGYMDLDAFLDWDRPVERAPGPRLVPGGTEPGLRAINAPLMWAAGYTGAGRIVMNIDTGVDVTHPALSYKWRGNHVPASQAWIDPGGGTTTPNDCDDHGTHTMGIMTGLATATSDTIGVAFGAEWIAAKTICTSPHTSNSIAAFQWAMDPDGNPGTITDMPDAIGNSWYDPSATDCGTSVYKPVFDAVEAAGIAIVFSCGNAGPGASSITIPKNINTTLVNVFSVGNLNGNDPNYPIASTSSRGPSICGGTGSLLIKPEVSAPGTSVRSSIIGGGYDYFSGTSMACPHVVGAIALLKEAHPNKTGAEIKLALYNTAWEVPADGTPGEDNNYGMGLIDVWAAHLALADPLDPKPVTNASAFSDYTTPTSVLLSWTDPNEFESGDTLIDFDIVILRDSVPVDTVAGGVETYTDVGLTDGVSYDYTIHARALPSDSLSQGVDVQAIAGGSPTPASPAGLTLTGDTANGYVIRWTNPNTQDDGTILDDFAGIRVYRNGDLVGTLVRTSTDTARMDSTTDNPGAGLFSYYVTAIDNESTVHESDPSNTGLTPLSVPFTDEFPVSGAPNPGIWIATNVAVDDRAVSEPSPPYSLNLNGNPTGGGDVCETLPMDLTGMGGTGLALAYYWQPRGTGDTPETADSLIVEFLNDQGQWMPARRYPGSSTAVFTLESISVDGVGAGTGTFFFNGFKFRFRSKGTTGAFDDWFVDDVFFGVPSGAPAMEVAPLAIADTVLTGLVDTTSYMFTVSNANPFASPLNFAIAPDTAAAWLTVTPLSGSVGANGEQAIKLHVDFSTATAGVYSADLVITGNDTTNAADTVVVTFIVNDSPVISVAPDTVVFSLMVDEVDSSTYTIFNTGAGPLVITDIEAEEVTMALSDPLFVQEQKVTPAYGKGEQEPVHDPIVEGQGGPDPFGYKWIDSDEPGGPTYVWNDISGTGTLVTGWVATSTYDPRDEGYAGPFNLGFSFSFYGQTYSQVWVSSNGLLELISPTATDIFSNAAIPASAYPNAIICPFWDDLDGSTGGTVHYEAMAGKFVIQFTNWPRYSTTGSALSFQIVLHSSGKIECFYNTMTSTILNSATIGIENGDGTIGTQIAYNAAYVHNSLAVRISRGATWLTQSPTSGVVAAGDSLLIMARVNATGLVEGTYIASVRIFSNDPTQGVLEQPVVRLEVTDILGIERELVLPTEYALRPNFPNPFNPSTVIRFQLPVDAAVSLKVYNLLGQEVRTLVSGAQTAGFKKVVWDGRNNGGQSVSSGIYVYRLQAPGFVKSRKMMLLK